MLVLLYPDSYIVLFFVSLEEIFVKCGGDVTEPQSWTSLKVISRTGFDNLLWRQKHKLNLMMTWTFLPSAFHFLDVNNLNSTFRRNDLFFLLPTYLQSVNLSGNGIVRLDSSLRLLPKLETLDLSHNLLTSTEHFLEVGSLFRKNGPCMINMISQLTACTQPVNSMYSASQQHVLSQSTACTQPVNSMYSASQQHVLSKSTAYTDRRPQ